MDYNSPENLAACRVIVEQAAKLLYYSHIPTSAIAVIIGFFVLLKDRRSLVSKILFTMAISFALWTTIDLMIWLNYDKNTLIMFGWSFFGILYALIYALSLYFVYVFIDKKDISISKKIILGLLLLPIILLTPTRYNLVSYDTVNCIAVDGNYFSNYYYLLGLGLFFWIVILSFFRYRKADKEFKKPIIFLALGISLFLFSFFLTGFLMNYLISSGYIAGGDYGMEQYGLFGMPVFIAFLAYLIVKHKAFNIKLIGTEALVVALIILIGSQFFFIHNNTNRILTGITFLLAVIFGFILVKSVKLEVKRKEELQAMTEELSAANDKLRKLDNVKSEFISIASHQLRTPLTSIKGYGSLLLEGTYGKIDPVILDPINKMYISNEHLIQLVEELLNVSRIESGRMDYTFKKHQIADIIKELFDTFILVAKNKKMFLNLDLPKEPLPEIEVDASKIREIISNLIDNSFKYTKKGGVTVKAELVESSSHQAIKSSGSVVKITISDTGIGIPKEEFPYLFTKFSRGKDTSRLHVGGTGLGLYVGRSMIEAQHGKIWAESDGADKGAKFIIELPLTQPKET